MIATAYDENIILRKIFKKKTLKNVITGVIIFKYLIHPLEFYHNFMFPNVTCERMLTNSFKHNTY